MKTISVVNATTVRNHQANNSPSKVAFRFSGSKRFPGPNPECPHAFYSYSSQLSNRKTTLGYGNKSDFTQTLTASPPATKYEQRSDFDFKNRGKSFGLSRDKSPDNSYLVPQLSKVPGPGNYENQKETKMNVSYTMRPRTLDMIDKNKTYRQAPGPGNYQDIDLEQSGGRFKFSKFTDSKFCKINPKTPRFESAKESPGPSNYQEGDGISGKAKYVLSQRKGSGTRAFDHEARFTIDHWKPSKNPGPQEYEKPSDFGKYGDSKYYKTLSNFH